MGLGRWSGAGCVGTCRAAVQNGMACWHRRRRTSRVLCRQSSSAHDQWCRRVPVVGQQSAVDLCEGTGAVAAVRHAEHTGLRSPPVAVRGGLLGILPTVPYARHQGTLPSPPIAGNSATPYL